MTAKNDICLICGMGEGGLAPLVASLLTPEDTWEKEKAQAGLLLRGAAKGGRGGEDEGGDGDD